MINAYHAEAAGQLAFTGILEGEIRLAKQVGIVILDHVQHSPVAWCHRHVGRRLAVGHRVGF